VAAKTGADLNVQKSSNPDDRFEVGEVIEDLLREKTR
jgi:hypothetical protein